MYFVSFSEKKIQVSHHVAGQLVHLATQLLNEPVLGRSNVQNFE